MGQRIGFHRVVCRRFGRRGVVASLTGAAVLATVLTACASVAGTATMNTISSRPSTATATSAPSSTTPVSVSSPAVSDIAGSGSASASLGVAGLPHAAPLPDNVLLGTRSTNGSQDLYQIDATTGAVGQQLTSSTSGPQYPILSPDRGTVAYVQSGAGGQLRTVAVDGGGDRQMFASLPPGCEALLRPAWNPVDPTELAVACVKSDGSTEPKLIGVDGTVRRTLNPGVVHLDDLAFSPDGATLLYWGSPNKDDNGGPLYLQSADGNGPPRQITTPGGANDADASFSPDGTRIVFRRATTSSSQIISVHADGSDLTPITDGTSYDQAPTISPDGSQIAFKSSRNHAAGASDAQIWVIGMDGSGLRQLGIGSPGIADGAPAWGHR
jgi:Tol biopolymer transport system component